MQRLVHVLAMLISVVVLVLMAVNVLFFIFVRNIELFSVDSPLAYAVLVILALAVFIAINAIKESRILLHRGSQGTNTHKTFSELFLVIPYLVGILVYVQLLKYLRFLPGTLIFMAVGMFLLNDTKQRIGIKLARVLLAVVITVPVLYAVFHLAFGVMLP